MRLQELKSKDIVRPDELAEKQVCVFLQSRLYILQGQWHWSLETDAVFCSDVMFSFPPDFVGTRAIFHPDDLAAVKASLAGGDKPGTVEFRLITTYGEVKTIRGENITVADGPSADIWQEQAVQAAARIAEEKGTHDHLQLLKEVDERTARFSGTGAWYYNSSTHQTWYADFVYRLHGLPPQGLNAHLHTFLPYIHPDDKPSVTEYTDKAFHNKTSLHLDYRILVNGEEKWVSFKSLWFYGERGAAILGGIYQDITDQKAAEREAESLKNVVQFQRQQLQFDELQVNVGHWKINLLTRKASFSDQYFRLFGVKAAAVAPTFSFFLNYIHPDDRGRVEAAHRQMLYEHATPELEFRVIRSDGKIRHLLQKAKMLVYEQELNVCGILQDITVQRMLEQKVAALHNTLQQHHWMLQQQDDLCSTVSWLMDLEEKTIHWSESFYRLAGFSKMQPVNVTEKTLFSIVHPNDGNNFRQNWAKAVQQREESRFDFRIMQRGSVHYMKAIFRIAVQDEKYFFVGTLRDTTGEQVLQQQLAQRVQLAESLTENIPDRVIITDNDHNILLWNKAAEAAYGLKKIEVIGENFFDVFPHLKTEGKVQDLHQVLRGEKVVKEGLPSHGEKGFYNLYLVPLYQEGKVYGVLHVAHDVTREKELHYRLHDRLQLIESLVQSSVDRIAALDHNMNYLYWNKQAEEYYGLSREEVVGKNIMEVFPRLVNDPSYSDIRRALRGETIYLPMNAEEDRFFETYLIPIKNGKGEVSSVVWIAHDLQNEWRLQQEQSVAKQRLEEEHRRLKEAQAVGHVGSFVWSVGDAVSHWSDELYRINGLEPQSEEMTLEKVNQLMHPADLASLRALQEKSLVRAGRFALVHRIVLRSGEVRWVNHQWESIAGENGKVERVTGVVQDITERKKAEEEILRLKDEVAQQATDKYSSLFNSIDQGFFIGEVLYDAENRPVDICYHESNPAANRILGQEMAGKSLRTLNPAYEDFWLEVAAETVATGLSRRMEHYSTADQRWYDFNIFKIGDKASRLVAVVFADVTGRKKAEDQLRNFNHTLQQQVEEHTRELQENAAFIQEICQIIPELITIHDAATTEVIYTNHADYWKLFYHDNEIYRAAEQKRARWFVHPDDKTKLDIFLAERLTLVDDEVKSVDLRMKEDRWIRIRSKVFKRDNGGAARQIISFTTEITDEKTAELEEKKHLAILQQAEEMAQMGSWEYHPATCRFKWSEGMYGLFALPPGKAVTPDVYLYFATDEDQAVAKRIVKYLKKSQQSFEETLHIKRGHGERLLKIKGSVVRNEAGRPERMVGVDVDITDIKEAEQKLEESRNLLEQTAQASPDCITIYDLRKKQPVYLNDCLATWLDTTTPKLMEMGIEGRLKKIHADDRLTLLLFNEKLKGAQDGQVLTLEYRLLRNDGSIRWVRNRSKVFQRSANGEVTHILSILQDVTEEKAAEGELKALNVSLEKKNAELESKNEEITSFAFLASHDLREPLRKILTFSDFLLTREVALSGDGRHALEKMNSSVKLLDRLIDDILALTKVHVDKERMKKVDLNQVLRRLEEDMQEGLQQTGASIKVAKLPEINGVENQLFYLFKNLVSNGLKFQEKNKVPIISIHTKEEDGYLKISFTDNGIGIAPEYHKKIFGIFRRLHGRAEFEGTGMGLAICKKIMEKHGGTITVESEAGNGAVFTCWFPAALATH